MAVSRAMRRVLRVRQMEEEMSQGELEEAVGSLRRLEAALDRAGKREREGRRQVTASAGTGEVIARVAGIEEMRAGRRHKEALQPRIAETEREVAARRAEFLARRTERRQVETLIQKKEAEDRLEDGRRAQRELDDWFLTRTEGFGSKKG